LERELKETQISGGDTAKIRGKMFETRKAVFTDERKLEQRK
jgi:hypothetical protein